MIQFLSFDNPGICYTCGKVTAGILAANGMIECFPCYRLARRKEKLARQKIKTNYKANSTLWLCKFAQQCSFKKCRNRVPKQQKVEGYCMTIKRTVKSVSC